MEVTFTDSSMLCFFLSHATSLIDKKSGGQHEYSGYVYVNVKVGGIEVVGCNLHSSFERVIPQQCYKVENLVEGEVVLLGTKLLSFLKTYGEQPVTLKLDGNMVLLRSGRSRVKIETLPTNVYPRPSIAQNSCNISFSIKLEILQEGLKLVKNCMPREHRMSCLNGVRVQYNSGKLSFIATDAQRVSVYQRNVATEISCSTEQFGFCLPVSAVNQLSSLTSEKKSGVIRVTSSSFIYEISTLRYQSKLLEDHNYPNIEQIIPKESVGHCSFDKKEFSNLLERVNIAVGSSGRSDSKIPRVELQFADDGMVNVIGGLQSSPDANDQITPLDYSYQREGLSTAHNYFSLSSSLSAIEDTKILVVIAPQMNRGSITNNLILKPLSKKPYQHFYMNLPIR